MRPRTELTAAGRSPDRGLAAPPHAVSRLLPERAAEPLAGWPSPGTWCSWATGAGGPRVHTARRPLVLPTLGLRPPPPPGPCWGRRPESRGVAKASCSRGATEGSCHTTESRLPAGTETHHQTQGLGPSGRRRRGVRSPGWVFLKMYVETRATRASACSPAPPHRAGGERESPRQERAGGGDRAQRLLPVLP